MQAGHRLGAAPITSPGHPALRIGGQQGGRDGLPLAFGDEHQPVIGQVPRGESEELARQVRRAAVGAVGEAVAVVKEVPVRLADLRSLAHTEGHAGFAHIAALLADLFALGALHPGEEIVEVRVVG